MNPKPTYRRTSAPRPSTALNPADQRQPHDGPLTIPAVDFTIYEGGTMTVTIDGTQYAPEPYAPPWQRNSFPMIIDTLTAHYQTPIRVLVREADGSTFTDIITPPKARATDAPISTSAPVAPVAPTFPSPFTTVPPPIAAVHAHSPSQQVLPQHPVPSLIHEVSAEGFVPGEDVAVAVITTHCDASNNGITRVLLAAEQLAASPTNEVIMLGRVSGTLIVGRPE